MEETKEDIIFYSVYVCDFFCMKIYTHGKIYKFVADFLLTVIVLVPTVKVDRVSTVVEFWKSYSLSNSNDLIEYKGDFGSRLCTSMSCLDVTRPVRTIFCNNDFSDAGNSLSSSEEVLL